MNTSPCTPNPLLSSVCSYGTKCCANSHHPELVAREEALDELETLTCACGKPSAHESGWCGIPHTPCDPEICAEDCPGQKPQTVKEYMDRARAAGHDALGIANDPESWPLRVHPKTGHETAIPKPPDWQYPDEFTIEISKSGRCWPDHEEGKVCSRGTKGCDWDHEAVAAEGIWYADIVGADGERKWTNSTHGDTPAQAVYMALDLVKMFREECSPEDREAFITGEHHGHCFCRDTTFCPEYRNPEEPEVLHMKTCCRCGESRRTLEFEVRAMQEAE